MDSRDEKFIPETVDEQEEQRYQILHHLEQRSARGKFIYTSKKIGQSDIRSLDRVWERLVEHVTRNSIAYETNRNVLGFHQAGRPHNHPCGRPGDRDIQAFRKRSTIYQSLSTIAAIFILALIVGSMVLVLHAAHQAGSSQGASGQEQVTPAPGKQQIPAKVEMSIIQDKNGIEFTPKSAKLLVGGMVIWNNRTDASQLIMNDSKTGKEISLAPGGSVTTSFPQAGTYVFHLASGAKAVIEVLDVPPVPGNVITIVPSKVEGGVVFSPTDLKLAVGSVIIWINDTDQTQTIAGDSGSQSFDLGPKMATKMRLDNPGSYSWFLQSNPKAQVTIVVGA